jgi:biotin transport system permease protein
MAAALAFTALLVAAAALAAGIRPWHLLRGIRGLAITLCAIMLLRTASGQDLKTGILFCALVVVSFALGALLFATSTMTELCGGLGKIELFLRAPFGRKRPRVSLAVALMLSFIPRFFTLWEDASLACEGRGKKAGFGRTKLLLALAVERLMHNAADTALALENRGYL